MKYVIWTIVVEVILAVGIGLAVIYSGVINVGADATVNPVMDWVLGTTSDHSVEHHASGTPTIDLNNPQNILTGAGHYKEMCQICHGYPGGERSEISKGLNPQPPDLADAGKNWPPQQIYWIVKHGVQMTAMPAFGKTHSDDKLWMIVAFVKKYPSLTKESYQEMMKRAPAVD